MSLRAFTPELQSKVIELHSFTDRFQSDTYWFHSHSSFGAPGNQSKERNPANKVAKRICILFLGI